MKTLKISPVYKHVQILDWPGPDVDYTWYADRIGCEWIEVVYPKGYPYCLVVDEEGLLNEKLINPYASYMYGMQIHGQPIVGSALILKQGEDGQPEGFTDDEAEDLVKKLENNFETIVEILGA